MRLVGIFLFLAILFLIPFLIWGDEFEAQFSRDEAAAQLAELGRWGWIAALGLLVADLVLPVPSTAVISALGLVYGAVVGGLIGAAGSFLSGSVAYGLCRLLGRRAAAWLTGERDLERGERVFARVGGWAVVISRWLPLLPEVVSCFAGLVKMPAALFFTALALGSLPMAFTFATIGYAGEDSPWLAIALSAVIPLLLWPLASRLVSGNAAPLHRPSDPSHRPEPPPPRPD